MKRRQVGNFRADPGEMSAPRWGDNGEQTPRGWKTEEGPVDPKNHGGEESEGFKDETRNCADENVSPRVLRTEALRVSIKEDLDVAVKIAGVRRVCMLHTCGVPRAARFPEVKDLELAAEGRCPQDTALVTRERDLHLGGTESSCRSAMRSPSISPRVACITAQGAQCERSDVQMGIDRQGTKN